MLQLEVGHLYVDGSRCSKSLLVSSLVVVRGFPLDSSSRGNGWRPSANDRKERINGIFVLDPADVHLEVRILFVRDIVLVTLRMSVDNQKHRNASDEPDPLDIHPRLRCEYPANRLGCLRALESFFELAETKMHEVQPSANIATRQNRSTWMNYEPPAPNTLFRSCGLLIGLDTLLDGGLLLGESRNIEKRKSLSRTGPCFALRD